MTLQFRDPLRRPSELDTLLQDLLHTTHIHTHTHISERGRTVLCVSCPSTIKAARSSVCPLSSPPSGPIIHWCTPLLVLNMGSSSLMNHQCASLLVPYVPGRGASGRAPPSLIGVSPLFSTTWAHHSSVYLLTWARCLWESSSCICCCFSRMEEAWIWAADLRKESGSSSVEAASAPEPGKGAGYVVHACMHVCVCVCVCACARALLVL